MKYKSGYKYQLVEDIRVRTTIRPSTEIDTDYIHLGIDGWLLVREGYACDGPSGPTWDSPSSIRGSFFHDALYQLIRMRLLSPTYRPEADTLFYDVCLEDGMWKWRAWIWHRAVRRFAAGAATPGHTKPILEAP